WQFGVLRSIGVTRGQLLRLVMGEAMLLGIVGCTLGLTAGMLMSADARQLSLISLGLSFPLYIPWRYIWLGVGIVMAATGLASLWTAVAVSRQEPLALLQAGRAAA